MASVLIVEDEASVASTLGTFLDGRAGYLVTRVTTGSDGIAAFRRERPDVVLLGLHLPDMTSADVLDAIRVDDPVVIVLCRHGDQASAVTAMEQGAESVLAIPPDLSHVGVVVERALEKAQLRRMNRYLERRHAGGSNGARAGAGIPPADTLLLGSSPAMRDLSDQIGMLATSDRTTVLLLGESGSGKGRVAEAIHGMSPRAGRPFVDVNCAALTPHALDRELFGHEHGRNGSAITGLFELAHTGSIFLDEIGDLDQTLQPKLLRVLEGKGASPVGGSREIPVNVRLIAATSKDLVNEVTAGRFREDLYYRLSVMPVNLPPLRARSRDDLKHLIGSMVEELHPQLVEAPRELSDGALDCLMQYAWPGNIRELRNVIERAMIVGRCAPAITCDHLPVEVRTATGAVVEQHAPRLLSDVERVHIERTLRALRGNRTHAARELGISRATLIKKIREYGLEV